MMERRENDMILVPLDGSDSPSSILPYARVFAVIAMSTHRSGFERWLYEA